MTYHTNGKQVLRDTEHVADCTDTTWAQIVVSALNGERVRCQPVRHEHNVTRQQDEYACSCGKRWPVSDGVEHPPG